MLIAYSMPGFSKPAPAPTPMKHQNQLIKEFRLRVLELESIGAGLETPAIWHIVIETRAVVPNHDPAVPQH